MSTSSYFSFLAGWAQFASRRSCWLLGEPSMSLRPSSSTGGLPIMMVMKLFTRVAPPSECFFNTSETDFRHVCNVPWNCRTQLQRRTNASSSLYQFVSSRFFQERPWTCFFLVYVVSSAGRLSSLPGRLCFLMLPSRCQPEQGEI